MPTESSPSAASIDKGQLDKFKEAARDLDCDDDPKRFTENLGKLVRRKPEDKPKGN